MKEQTEKNSESLKVAEIEAPLKEAEKVPFAEVLVSTFKDHTVPESRELKERHICQQIYGRTQEENSAIMVFTRYLSEEEVKLEIFKHKSDVSRIPGDVVFFAGRPFDSQSPSYVITYKFPHKKSLTSEYDRWLIKIVDEIGSKVAQIPEETRKLYEEGIIPKGGGDMGGAGSRSPLTSPNNKVAFFERR